MKFICRGVHTVGVLEGRMKNRTEILSLSLPQLATPEDPGKSIRELRNR